MDILSLHCPLPNAAIDNKDIFNAPPFFEYDAIIFHPLGFEQSILNWLNGDEEFYTASGEKVIQKPSGNNARNINEIMEQRKNEIDKFLKRDGILIIYTVPEMSITAEEEQPDIVTSNIFARIFSKIFSQSSKQNVDELPDEKFATSRYFLFNLDKAIYGYLRKNKRPEDPFIAGIIPGSGFTNMTENDFIYSNNNIFQNVLHNHANNIAYQAYFDESIIHTPSIFKVLLTTAKSETPIAVAIGEGNGQIFFLPCLTQANTDEAMAEARSLVDDIESIMNK